MKINRVGKIGEIYTDSTTGKSYKCVYAYKDSTGSVDCDWEEIVSEMNVSEDNFQTKPEIESEKIPEGKIPEKQIDVTGNTPRSNKTRYTNYSRK